MVTKSPKFDAAQKKVVAQLTDLRGSRSKAQLNQSEYWSRYGVTQSGGSRYESGRTVPSPTRILMALHLMGVVSDEDLARAGAVAAKLGKAVESDE